MEYNVLDLKQILNHLEISYTCLDEIKDDKKVGLFTIEALISNCDLQIKTINMIVEKDVNSFYNETILKDKLVEIQEKQNELIENKKIRGNV